MEMEKLVEVCEPAEVRIEFTLNSKCRTTIQLKSLNPTKPIAFKIQTSSPLKFLVNPPTGLIPPLSISSFQVILKPQSHLPPSYPRSPKDRFLIKTTEFTANSSDNDSINALFASCSYGFSTYDIKLKVAFVGSFLLCDAVSRGDLECVRSLIKRQRSVVLDLSLKESESLLRVATELAHPDDMVHILLEAGLRVHEAVGFDKFKGSGDVPLVGGNVARDEEQHATNIIIHGIRVHHCRPQAPGMVMGPNGNIIPLGQVDGDAIRLVSASKIWIDHTTLYDCQDGLLDVTRGSTDVTISNNWFREQNKVMLLGHDDGFVRDKNMKVTVVYNYFGPNCHQRMPRIRHGYAHVANNLYMGWVQYAIGGNMEPSLKSQSNLFIAPTIGNKEVTWRKKSNEIGDTWEFYSVGDAFENGASFIETKDGHVTKPNYSPEQNFEVADAKFVRLLTRSSGVLQCSKTSIC